MTDHPSGNGCKLADLTPDELRNTIVRKEKLSPVLTLFEIRAPLIARAVEPGQFVMVWAGEHGERIPLTVSDWAPANSTITLIFQEVGRGTIELGRLKEGDEIPTIAGPLGRPTEIENYGTAVVIGGGVGTAIARPVAAALRKAGNHLITIIGARERSLIILEDEMRACSDELIITTDDGSYGRKGVVTDPLKELLDTRNPLGVDLSLGGDLKSPPSGLDKIDIVFAIGPMIMMRFVAKTTEPYGVKTIVSLDPIMIDGTGMCGGCRVTVGGKTMFTCVDGPDFDAHQVDWDELKARKSFYFDQEQAQREAALKA